MTSGHLLVFQGFASRSQDERICRFGSLIPRFFRLPHAIVRTALQRPHANHGPVFAAHKDLIACGGQAIEYGS